MYEAEGATGRVKAAAQGGASAPLPSPGEEEKKSKKQLLEELFGLRQKIEQLEAFENERKAIAKS